MPKYKNTTFSFLEFDNAVRLDLLTNKTWRAGQGMFNTLHRLNSDIANEIRGTQVDPFYRNDAIPDFMTWLTQRMGW